MKNMLRSIRSVRFLRSMRSLRAALCVAVLSQLLALLFVACERRPLEVLAGETVSVRIVVDWQYNFVALYGTVPNGMTVMIWPSDGSAPIVRTTNADNVTVQLKPDTYRLIVFNELADDYAPYLQFRDADNYDRMALRATTFTVGTARGWDDGTYMYTPEDPRIAVALDTFDITPQMVLSDTTIFIPYEVYRDNGFTNPYTGGRVYEIPELPWPMTVDLFVRLRVKHRESLRAIEGSISGLADGFYLSHIIRTSETGTIRFNPDNWDRNKYGEDSDSMGIISTRVASFGLPYGKELLAERDSADNMLNLSLRLTNDSVLNYRFKVGKTIRYITPEGTEARIRYRQDLQHLELEVALPDIIDLPPIFSADGTGFNARVDEWEDGGTWDLGGF